MKKILLLFVTFALMFGYALPISSVLVYAEGEIESGAPAPPGEFESGPPNRPGTDVNSLQNRPSVKLKNPLGEGSSIVILINNIMNFLVRIGAIIFTIMVLIGAFQMITSAGSPEKTKNAKMTILWGAIGYAIILMAKGITAIVKSFFIGSI